MEQVAAMVKRIEKAEKAAARIAIAFMAALYTATAISAAIWILF